MSRPLPTQAMRIGFVGLGKLGLPIAMAIEARGYEVVGCDPDPAVARTLQSRKMVHREEGAQPLLDETGIELLSLDEVVRRSDLVFVTIQTPHDPRFEGVTPLPAERRDFDYTRLIAGMRDVAAAVERHGVPRVVVVVSTVLPGTLRRDIVPLLGPLSRLCYNPFFIAMGTAIADFLHPEFVLLGADDEAHTEPLRALYASLVDAPVVATSIENAELIKVLYNTFVSTKIAFANTAMEICHRVPGADVDTVLSALKLGTKRVISDRYLSGGMGDGGACHPRDNIALSHLSRSLGLSFDWFESVMLQRERQTAWLADLVQAHAHGRDVVVLGRSFKPESDIETGSPARLLCHLLEQRGVHVTSWDPQIDPAASRPAGRPFCYFVGTRHEAFRSFGYEPGSVVLDPFRYVPQQPGVDVVPIGVGAS